MKTEIHPNYYVAQVSCACGNKFSTRSTLKDIKVEICAACHPFYTGRQRLVDTAGRVERFQKRFAKTEGRTVERKPQTKVKKLDTLTAAPKRAKKVLTTAPTKAEKGEKKDAKKKPAQKD